MTLLMGLLAVAYANGPNMDDGTKKECDVVFKCFAKECGDSDRDCFFDCLTKRDVEMRVGRDFRQGVKKVYEWCKSNKRGNGASGGRILKCTQKKVEKDACRWYLRDMKPTPTPTRAIRAGSPR